VVLVHRRVPHVVVGPDLLALHLAGV
jgi:hypothetical protein